MTCPCMNPYLPLYAALLFSLVHTGLGALDTLLYRCSGCGAWAASAKPRLPRRCITTCNLDMRRHHASWQKFAARAAMAL